MSVLRFPPRAARPAAAALVLLPILLIVGMLTAASPASAVKPKNDHARMPRTCAKPAELIPQVPTVCHLNDFKAKRPTVLLWGDSHAWMMIPALKTAAKGKQVNLVAVVMGGCPPMDNRVKSTDSAPSCHRSNALALEYITQLRQSGSAVRVLLGGSWGRYRQAVKTKTGDYTAQIGRQMRTATPRLMKKLAKRSVLTDVIGQVAIVPAKRRKCAAGEKPFVCDVVRRKALPDEKGTKQWLKRAMKPLAGNRNPININGFCDQKVCHGKVGKWYTWWDDLHISATMSRKVHKVIKPTINRVIKQAAANEDKAKDPPVSTNPCPIPIPILCG